MPTDGIKDFSSATLYTDDGEELLKIPSLSISDMEIETSEYEHPNFNFLEQSGFSLDLDITDFNGEVLDELLGKNKSMRIVDYKLIQNKRHKKKRINKKWAKKYGYTAELYTEYI